MRRGRRLDAVRRRDFAGLLAVAAAMYFGPAQMRLTAGEDPQGFSFASVRGMAKSLAAKDYRPENNSDLPDEFKKMTYDQYQRIRFRPEHSLWKDDHVRFTVQFFHRGYLYLDPVKIRMVDAGQVSDVPYSTEMFDFDGDHVTSHPATSFQFAGFKLLYPLNVLQKADEVAEFLGASYFRVLGAGQRYGSSLRGLAVDTAEPSGEEFPRFTDFWLEKPPQLAGGIRVLALMNSPSVAGAYDFTIEPGNTTVVDVQSSLFFRKAPKKIGLAPIGSLFMMGQNRTRFFPDFRPQVHDSDGLLVQSGDGTSMWRPLVNPVKTHRITRFNEFKLKGFGLMQRDRDFNDYEDLGARFELRPSYWVEPTGDWGEGAVELVEIPTDSDWNDNIVAYWTPRNMPEPGRELHFSYRILALSGEPDQSPLLRVKSTRILPENGSTPPRFFVDFAGTPPHRNTPSISDVKIQSTVGQAQNLVLQTNDATGGWRVFFDLAGAGQNRTELKLRFQLGTEAMSETWIYDYEKAD